ncbi:MAG: hypothetical protein GC165_10770 [Armatimonadetes bacterium]|nr:hypothetical protein [Armatimonadota bacterium]
MKLPPPRWPNPPPRWPRPPPPWPPWANAIDTPSAETIIKVIALEEIFICMLRFGRMDEKPKPVFSECSVILTGNDFV